MINEEQYKKLIKCKKYGEIYDGNLTDTFRSLLRKKYVTLYHPVLKDGKISDITICVITEIGKEALDEYECKMCEKCAEKEANKIKEKAQRTANRFDTLTFGVISAAVAGLVVYYWPFIFGFLKSIFHQ